MWIVLLSVWYTRVCKCVIPGTSRLLLCLFTQRPRLFPIECHWSTSSCTVKWESIISFAVLRIFTLCSRHPKTELRITLGKHSLSLSIGWLCVIMPSCLSHSLLVFAPFKALRFAEMSRRQLEERSLTDHSEDDGKRIWAGGRLWCWIWTGDVNESSLALCEMWKWTEVQDVCHVLRGLMWFVCSD